MTEQDIKLQLNKAKSLIKTDEAEASSVIFDLTNALGWEVHQCNFFYNRFLEDPNWYDEQSIIDGTVGFDYGMVCNQNHDPI